MNLYDLAKPLLFSLPAETAHRAVHGLLDVADGTPVTRTLADRYVVEDPRLRVDAFEQSFPNPVGVAAGFDKNAQIPGALASLGFGFVEVGGVTAVPQDGNPRPRMFRLREDEAIINRMGLNNHGADVIGDRLARTEAPVPVGVNIAKSEHVGTEEAPEDYRQTYRQVAEGGGPASSAERSSADRSSGQSPREDGARGTSPGDSSSGGDFFVVNVSCPNSQGFEELQNKDAMAAVLEELKDAGAGPLLVKLSPDLPEPAAEDALELVDELDLDGVVAVNTTTERPSSLRSDERAEEGGLSGKPIEDEATEMVRFTAERVDVPVVGVGGVSTAEGAYRKIRAGASVVELYTGLVYRGPSIAREINEGLLELLDRDGFDSVEDAVGVDL